MKFITNNWWLKIFALAIALMVYYIMRQDINRSEGKQTTLKSIFGIPTKPATERKEDLEAFQEAAERAARQAEEREQRENARREQRQRERSRQTGGNTPKPNVQSNPGNNAPKTQTQEPPRPDPTPPPPPPESEEQESTLTQPDEGPAPTPHSMPVDVPNSNGAKDG